MGAPPYYQAAFSNERRQLMVDWLVKHVRATEAQAIVACGQSGIVPASIVSYVTGVPLVAVRKDGEPGHSERLAHHRVDTEANRWVFIDDLVDSGKTLAWSCYAAYVSRAVAHPKPTAVLLYHESPYEAKLEDGKEARSSISIPRYCWDTLVAHFPLKLGRFCPSTMHADGTVDTAKLEDELYLATRDIPKVYTWVD